MTQYESYRDEDNKSHVRLWVGLIVGSIVMIIAMWRLATKLNWKMYRFKTHFWTRVKWMALGGVVLIVSITIVFALLNTIGKKDAYDKHYHDNKKK